MAKYRKIKIGSYRTRDGRKVGTHYRRVKAKRGTISRLKGLRSHFKGKMQTARREGANRTSIDKMKKRLNLLTRDINSVKLGNRKYRQGKILRKRAKGKR